MTLRVAEPEVVTGMDFALLAKQVMDAARGGPILAVKPERTQEFIEEALREAFSRGQQAASSGHDE